MCIRFAATIAGCFHAHQTCILPVLHVIDELAVFDEHSAIGGRAFIIDGQRTAAL